MPDVGVEEEDDNDDDNDDEEEETISGVGSGSGAFGATAGAGATDELSSLEDDSDDETDEEARDSASRITNVSPVDVVHVCTPSKNVYESVLQPKANSGSLQEMYFDPSLSSTVNPSRHTSS